MNNDEYFNQKIAEYMPVIEVAVGGDLERLLRLFAKDIERDTRHQAADMAQELANNIHNMTHRG
jgi:hypothetical protein